MECRELTDRAINRLLEEAAAAELEDFDRHLAGCECCVRELAVIEETWDALGADRDAAVTPEFRARTLALLHDEVDRRRIREFRPRARAARILARAAALFVAAVAGFAVARGGLPAIRSAGTSSPVAGPAKSAPDLAGNPRLSNVAYRTDPDGRVGIEFDATTRHTLVGRPDDPEVSTLLAYLLLRNGETAGEKSRAIELVSGHYGSGAGAGVASPEIVRALAATLKRDRNPGVRKKAAEALASFRSSPEIRTALLESLANDPNPGVRLVAVEALAASAREAPDPKTIQSLREKAVDPQENGFVRARAASALKAIDL